MWFWLIIGFIAVYFMFFRKKAKPVASNAVESNETESFEAFFRSGSDIKVGYQQIGDGGFIVGPDLPFPLTLYGLDVADVAKLVTDFEQQKNRGIFEWFTHVVAQKNVRCKEIEEWISNAKPKLSDMVKQRILASAEWAEASELDRKDLLIEMQNMAISELAIRPSDFRSSRILLLEEPHDLTIDDALLERFKDNPSTYQTLLYVIPAGTKVQVVSAGDYRRKAFDDLYDKGVMRRGQEIACEDILTSLTMKRMQEIAGADAPKKFTRKAHAIEFLKDLPDIWQRLGAEISFRELFQIKPIEGIDLDELAKAHAYSSQVALVVIKTLMQSIHNQSSRELFKDDVFEYTWELLSENCCKSCKAQHGKTWKNLPKKLPPFHIGCEAQIGLHMK